MKITEFIKLQNRELVESAHISFKLYLPQSKGGKWFFFCEPGQTVEDLCKWVEDTGIDVEFYWPDNSVEIEENGEDKDGNALYKYLFNLSNIQDN